MVEWKNLIIMHDAGQGQGWRGWRPQRSGGTCSFLTSAQYTLYPTPYTLHPTPFTLHPTPYTLHLQPHTLHPTPYTLHLQSKTQTPKPKPRNSSPCTPHPCQVEECSLHPNVTLNLSPPDGAVISAPGWPMLGKVLPSGPYLIREKVFFFSFRGLA